MSESEQDLTQEAADPKTSPERLRQLCTIRIILQPVIASNPNCDVALLNFLATSHPRSVLANPVLRMHEVETRSRYAQFSLKSLVCLAIACESKEQGDLIREVKRRIQEGIEELEAQEEASLTCTWLYQRTFVLNPDECDGLIDEPIHFDAEIRAYMEGSDSVSIYGLPHLHEETDSASQGKRKELKEFFSAIAAGNIRAYLSDDEIIREDGGGSDYEVRASGLPAGLLLDGLALYRVQEDGEDECGDLLFEFALDFNGHNDDPVRLEDGYLHVLVEHVDEIDHEYDLSMGQLSELIGLEIDDPEGGRRLDWPSRLAELLSRQVE